MRRRVEIILGGIRTLRFRAAMGGVTPAGRRLAAFGVNALNGGDFGERSAAGVTGNVEQQPGDIGGIRSVFASCRLGGDFAAIGQFPGRSGAMMPNILPFASARSASGACKVQESFSSLPAWQT